MKKRAAALTTVAYLSLAIWSAARAETPAIETAQKGAAMANHARGTFEVKMTPLPNDEKVKGLTVGRLSGEKQFRGELEGSSVGEMTAVETSVQGSAGYVAVERVTGTLKGRSGAFVLLHQGTMRGGGDFKMSIVVVPDSATGQLAGLAGAMLIIIKDGKHFYEFDYTLPEAP